MENKMNQELITVVESIKKAILQFSNSPDTSDEFKYTNLDDMKKIM